MKTVLALVCGLVVLAAPSASAQSHLPLPQHHDRWMGELFEQAPAAEDMALSRFIFPGTHDSGTYELEELTACEGCSGAVPDIVKHCEEGLIPPPANLICGVVTSNVIAIARNWGHAQSLSIGGQLRAGARYLDLRFYKATIGDAIRSGNETVAGHYYIHHTVAGPESTVILNDIAAFLAAPGHEQEVILISLGNMYEGADEMGSASLQAFFDHVRQYLGPYMAPRPDPTCGAAGAATCVASARFGAATTIRELLAQGSQVVVMCDCEISAPDIWDTFDSESPYSVQDLLPPAGDGGYPTPDDSQFPWVSDAQVATMLDRMSAERDETSRNQFWGLGIQFGLDDNGVAILRSINCPGDTSNVLGACPAANSDWDEFRGLREVAEYTNPMTLGALVKVRRDRLNIISGDHYTPMWTDEIFKLNRGATRVEFRIDAVSEIGRHDPAGVGSDPDFYPVFIYPESTPLLYQVRAERNIQFPNRKALSLHWPGYKSYLNDWGTARVGFALFDADNDGNDDVSHINVALGEVTTNKFANVPITACVTDHLNCPNIRDSYVTLGAGDASALAFYSYYACLWSWLPGDVFDPASNCGEGLPDLSVSDVEGHEGDSGTRAFEFVVTLSAPSPTPVTVHYRTTGAFFAASARATAGEDHEEIADATLTFAAYETRKIVTVTVKGDTKVERNEWFSLELFSAAGATAVSPRGAAVILGDDVASLSIGSVAKTEGHSGSTAFTFPVTLAAPSSVSITVYAKTANGTAIAGSDYTAVADTLVTFSPGQTSRTVTVQVTGDPAIEGDETFSVQLHDAAGASVGALIDSGEGVGTIKNDDAPATLVAPAGQPGNEGTSIAVKLGTLVDPRPAGPWAISVKWGDAQAETFSVTAAGNLARGHTYADNGSFAVTVTAVDALQGVSNTITFVVTVANVSPAATLGNSGPIGAGSSATVGFTGAADPSSADTAAGLRFAFSCTNASLAAATYAGSSNAVSTSCAFGKAGNYSVRARVIDKDGGFREYSTVVTVSLPPNRLPVCTAARPSTPYILANPHTYANVTIAGVSDPDADTVQLSITGIRQDEPVTGVTAGDVSPDAAGIGTATAQLRYERADAGNGRVYHVAFTATDARGGSCTGEVTVGVRNGFAPAVDGGAVYDSTAP